MWSHLVIANFDSLFSPPVSAFCKVALQSADTVLCIVDARICCSGENICIQTTTAPLDLTTKDPFELNGILWV